VNFNVYIDDTLARKLAVLARRTGAPRNALIRKAIAQWVARSKAGWPTVVLEWEGDPSSVPFEELRAELAAPSADPFSSRTPSRPHRPRKARRRR
jgi:hypothetical protein